MSNTGLNLFIAPTGGHTEVATMLQRQAESQMMSAAAEVAMQEKKSELTAALAQANEAYNTAKGNFMNVTRELSSAMGEKLEEMMEAGNYLLAAAKIAAIRSLQDNPDLEEFWKYNLRTKGPYREYSGFYVSGTSIKWDVIFKMASTHGKVPVTMNGYDGRGAVVDVVDLSGHHDIIALIGRVSQASDDYAAADKHVIRVKESLDKLNSSAADVKAAMARHGLSQSEEGQRLLDMARAAIG
jgi:hypothetical protein